MIVFDIREETVRYWADDVAYRIAEKYYEEGKVKNISSTKTVDDTHKFTETHINSLVEDENKDLFNEIVFNDKSGVTKVRCQCMGFHNYYLNERICPHIAATMFKYIRDKDSIINIDNRYSIKSRRLFNEIKQGMAKTEQPIELLNMEVKLEINPWSMKGSNIEIKIGMEKLYVVKNVRDFIIAYLLKNNEIEYGKEFTFKPLIQYFSDEDKDIINLIQEAYEDDERNFGAFGSNSQKFLVGKKIYLTDIKVKRFMELISNRNISVNVKGITYKNVKVYDEKIPMKFELLEQEEDIQLSIEGEKPYPVTRDVEYVFYEENIYKINSAHRKLFIPFYNAFQREKENTISFNLSDGEAIASYIIPSLKKISDRVTIDSSLEQKFREETLSTKIYLDKSNDMIIATIKFCYGEIQINPLRKEEYRKEETVLVRDIQTELKIVNLFRSYKFQKYGDDFINNDEENIVEFLYRGINEIEDICEIYYSSSFKNFKIYNTANYIGGIRINDSDLLEFNFEIDGVDKSELKNIFNALKQKKKYYRLKKGGFVPLDSNDIKSIGNMIDYLDISDSDLEKDKIIIPKYNSLYIDDNIKNFNMNYFERNSRFKDLISSIKNVENSDFKIPKNLEKIMRKYQGIGFKWLKSMASCGFGGILADEMGLGKTLQVICLLASDIGEASGTSVVVAPTSLVYNWSYEIEKFYPDLKILIINGSKAEREKLIKDYGRYDLLITSYPLIRRDIDFYEDINFKYCILDEAQQIKNPNSINAKSVKSLKAQNYFALTGTPIENSLTELWSIFDFIMPGYLLSHSKFVKAYELPIVKFNDKVALEELNKHVRPFILRRLKKQVVKELPPKIEHKVLVEMSDDQKKVYAAYLQNAKDEIDRNIKEKGFDRSKIAILAVLTRLRQICCDPSIFIENYGGENGKLMALDNIIEENINSEHRILLFSQFTSVLKNISNHFKKTNIKHMYLDGQTKMEERGHIVEEFNEGDSKIFLISLKAGGTGLNLTGADIVIHYDPWWNPAVEQQASDRAHRIGQKKTVEVIKLITRGTIEEKIYEIQEKKKEIINKVMKMDNIDESSIFKMTEGDIKDIFGN